MDRQLGGAGIGVPALALDRDLDRVVGAVDGRRARRGARIGLRRLRCRRFLRGKVDAEEIPRHTANDEHADEPGSHDEALL